MHYLKFGRGSSLFRLSVYTANKGITGITPVSFQVCLHLALTVPITIDNSLLCMHVNALLPLSGIFSLTFVHVTVLSSQFTWASHTPLQCCKAQFNSTWPLAPVWVRAWTLWGWAVQPCEELYCLRLFPPQPHA